MAKRYRFSEAWTGEGCEVDREAGIIRNVRVLGSASRNGRDYERSAIDDAVRLLTENATVNFDHDRTSRERAVSDRAGWLDRVHLASDGARADLHLLTSDPRAGKILEAAEKRPRLFGLSIDATGKVEPRQSTSGRDRVSGIEEIFSVDIVTDPATTGGLFESLDTENEPVKTTIRKIVESVPKETAGRKRLVEMLDTDVVDDLGMSAVEFAPEASPEEQVEAGIEAAIIAVLRGEGTADEKIDKIAALLGLQEQVEETMAGGEASEVDAEGGENPDNVEESRKRQQPDPALAKLVERVEQMDRRNTARDLIEAKGGSFTSLDESRRQKLLACKDEQEMSDLIESWPPSALSAANRHARPAIGRRFKESGGDESISYEDARKAFVS